MIYWLILPWLKQVLTAGTVSWYPYDDQMKIPKGMTYKYISNDSNHYYVNLEVGTPGGFHKFVLDTTASHTLINVDALNWEKFDQSNSTTFSDYGDQAKYDVEDNFITKARGLFGSDLVSFRRKQYRIILGLSTEGTHPQVFGLGPKMELNPFPYLNEPINRDYEPAYPHFLEALKHDGVILRESFALWLVGAGKKTALLFGGLDRMAFKGDMHVVPLLDANPYQADGFARKMGVMLDSIVGHNGHRVFVRKPVLLDVSSPVTLLPESVIYQLLHEYRRVTNEGVYWGIPEVLKFDFGGFQIPINARDLIFSCTNKKICYFAMLKRARPPYVLGSTVLRSLYMVFDYESNTVGLAEAEKPEKVDTHSLVVISTGIPTEFVD